MNSYDRRKELNRIAAQKLRNKKKERAVNIRTTYFSAQSANTRLLYELKLLRREKRDLESALQNHLRTCRKPSPHSLPAIVRRLNEESCDDTASNSVSPCAFSSFDEAQYSFATERRLHPETHSVVPLNVKIERILSVDAVEANTQSSDIYDTNCHQLLELESDRPLVICQEMVDDSHDMSSNNSSHSLIEDDSQIDKRLIESAESCKQIMRTTLAQFKKEPVLTLYTTPSQNLPLCVSCFNECATD